MQLLTIDRQRFEKALIQNFPEKEFQKIMNDNLLPYKELMAFYRCAMMEVETKFNVMVEELSLQYDRNPIEFVKCRLKSVESIMGKLKRRGIFPSIENIEANIFDIAGIRVVCSYEADIYQVAEALLSQDDVTLVEKKDYIENPKPNGYRSLHLIIETPIYLFSHKKMMKVEVQLRTISMDCWASLEHKIKYKKDLPADVAADLEKRLLECADMCARLDENMEEIRAIADKYICY